MKYLLLLATIVFSTQVLAINGSYKTFFSSIENPYSPSAEGAVSNVLRTKFSWAPNETYSVQGAYVVSANVQKTIDPNIQTKREYRYFDLKNTLYPAHISSATNMTATQNLDRLYGTYNASQVTIKVGRQPVTFGSAKIVNPTDVLTPFTYQELDKEERIGVDAVRMNVSLGDLSLLDAGFVFGDKLQISKSASFVRFKVNTLDTDFSPLFMDFKNNLLVGLDISRNLGQASTWLEVAQVAPKYFENKTVTPAQYFRGTIGLDYKLTPALYSYFEYHYNGAGKADPAKYLLNSTTITYTEGTDSLKGIHYFIPGMSYEISPIWKVTGQFLFNGNDNSMLNNVLVEHSFAQDIYIDLGTYLPVGKKAPLVQKSEFGVYPKVFYTSLRLYF